MRLFSLAFRHVSPDSAPLLAGRSLQSRLLILGLPLLSLVLLVVFLSTGRGVESVVNRAISRNAQMQTQAMSRAIEQILVETRNQLLVLAAGPMQQQEMSQRLKFRAHSAGLRFREVAFMGLTPENRYLLVNYGGEIISVPLRVALESPIGPFQNISNSLRPGYVNVGQPQEVVYSMVPVNASLQSLALYVLRFSTPIYDAAGQFQGVLILSLDLAALRDTLSLFSSPEAQINAGGGETRVRSLFFDKDGWMLFQSEKGEANDLPLSSDAVRAGFRGDFGRHGFSVAFRPGPEHISYWNMVADVQNGRTGQFFPAEVGTSWNGGQLRVEGVSYAPVSFQPGPEAQAVPVGGLAVLDSSFATTNAGLRLLGIYILSFVGSLLLLGLSLWWLARCAGRDLGALTQALSARNERGSVEEISLPHLPRELESLTSGLNMLLERLRLARMERRSQEALQTAQWQREPAEGLPDPAELPQRGLIGFSAPMAALHAQIQKASLVSADVLVVGETGTGKELVSESIHRLSSRSDGPSITINCGALDEALLMDTLFGHVKGAFTEARQARKGAFLAAEGGTLMLDEVGNAAPKVQQSLLRALSTRRIRPLGCDHDVPFDTRIIAATNAELRGEQHGDFREDLYYRLAVITIHTPPLRQRKEDIPALISFFLAQAAPHAQAVPCLSRGALDKLMRHQWPGNVRELKNTLTRALAFCEGGLIHGENIQIGPGQLGLGPDSAPGPAREQGPPAGGQTDGQNNDPSGGRVRGQAAPDKNGNRTAHSSGKTSGISVNRPTRSAHSGAEPQATPQGAAQANSSQDTAAATARRWLAALSAEDESLLNARHRALLPQLLNLGSVSRQEYQSLAGQDISMRTAQYDLQLLVRLGLMRKEGKGPSQRYLLALDRLRAQE